VSITVLGLDVSYSATGWVALRGSDESVDTPPTVLAYAKIGPFEVPRDDEMRCARVRRIVDEILAPVQEFQPNVIGIEDYSFGSVEQAHRIGELHGVLMQELWRTNNVFDRVPIGTWRKLALGNGQLAKDQVRLEVMKRYNQEFKSIDVTEAFGVAVATWMRRIGADKPVPKRRQRLLTELPVLTVDPFA
jgi:Holliday junction resolvasome RuvABC endonuclease subunit